MLNCLEVVNKVLSKGCSHRSRPYPLVFLMKRRLAPHMHLTDSQQVIPAAHSTLLPAIAYIWLHGRFYT